MNKQQKINLEAKREMLIQFRNKQYEAYQSAKEAFDRLQQEINETTDKIQDLERLSVGDTVLINNKEGLKGKIVASYSINGGKYFVVELSNAYNTDGFWLKNGLAYISTMVAHEDNVKRV